MNYEKSFIEVQFPVSKVSKESYKERKANLGQTLTGLGKWWGRKPLVLVRAAILGLLFPASDDPKKDMEIFLKIMSMDKTGLNNRKTKSINPKDAFELLITRERELYFTHKNGEWLSIWKTGITMEEKATALEKAWNRMSYDQKLVYCVRPEEYQNTGPTLWNEINEHLGTKATNIIELSAELGQKRFGRVPVVGDCFCGGGSIPFEAARMGCDAFASDLNPIAGLLTWADLNIAGADDKTIAKIREFQHEVFDTVDKQIIDWGIETNEKKERANAFLYCNETTCPECGYTVPLSPSWIVGKGTMTAAFLTENSNSYNIEIKSKLNSMQMNLSEEMVTIKNSNMHCPHCHKSVPITSLRKDTSEGYGLRQWEKNEYVPRENDTFRERLYCIRYEYEEEFFDNKGDLKMKRVRYYTSPSSADLDREQKVLKLLSDRFIDWQEKGYIPNNEIEAGYNTSQLIRERGWKYWHQLFNPRQLLIHGLFMKTISEMAKSNDELVVGLLGVNKIADWDSKLCIWNVGAGVETSVNTYTNQALNTLYNYGARSGNKLADSWFFNINNAHIITDTSITLADARNLTHQSDLWVTDPPYADAVNYHELRDC